MEAASMAQANPARLFFKRLFRRKLVLVATIVLGVIVLAALLAPWVAPFKPDAMRMARRLKPPSDINWLGTDEFGRDILSRIIFGGRASLGIGAAVVVLSMSVGTVFGLLAGYVKGLDALIMRLADAMMALPDILLAIFLVAILGPSAGNVVLALSIVYAPRVVRVVRASTLVVSELPFVEAARAVVRDGRRVIQAIAGQPGDFGPACAFAPRCPMAQAQCGLTPPALESDGQGDIRCLRWREWA